MPKTLPIFTSNDITQTQLPVNLNVNYKPRVLLGAMQYTIAIEDRTCQTLSSLKLKCSLPYHPRPLVDTVNTLILQDPNQQSLSL